MGRVKGLLVRERMEKMTMSMSLKMVRLETGKEEMGRRRWLKGSLVVAWVDPVLGRMEMRQNQVWEVNPGLGKF